LELHLDHNELGVDTAISIAHAIQHHSSLSLRVLNLNSNHIQLRGCQALCDSLQFQSTAFSSKEPALEYLGMNRNNIAAPAGQYILSVLDAGRNVTLQRMDLMENQISRIDMEQIYYFLLLNRYGRRYVCSHNHQQWLDVRLWPRLFSIIDYDCYYHHRLPYQYPHHVAANKQVLPTVGKRLWVAIANTNTASSPAAAKTEQLNNSNMSLPQPNVIWYFLRTRVDWWVSEYRYIQ
jgi:hypothetical protein